VFQHPLARLCPHRAARQAVEEWLVQLLFQLFDLVANDG
jgi:hypothetical protein